MRIFNVGLLYIREEFGKDLNNRLNSLGTLEDKEGKPVKIEAEHILIHEISINHKTKYDLIIDRASHALNYSIGVFMAYAFKGVYIINNPLSFHYFIDNKDVGFTIANELGINVPETYVLPSCINFALQEKEDFQYHRVFDWDKIIEKVGLPCYIKPSDGRAGFGVNKVNSKKELIDCYNKSGVKVMTVQSAVASPYNWHIRCICVGKKIIPIKFIFGENDQSKYIFEEQFLTAEQGRKVIDFARVINQSFGYEMNSIEFILDYNNEPWAIDFNNPIPDSRKNVLGEIYYKDYMESMVERVCEIAKKTTQSLFLPKLNEFSIIAQMPISKEDKFKKALEVANKYYESD